MRAELTASVLYQAAGDVSEELSCGLGERLLGDSCFWVSSDRGYNWYAANDLCKSFDMTLAFIQTQEEDDLIFGECACMLFYWLKVDICNR